MDNEDSGVSVYTHIYRQSLRFSHKQRWGIHKGMYMYRYSKSMFEFNTLFAGNL